MTNLDHFDKMKSVWHQLLDPGRRESSEYLTKPGKVSTNVPACDHLMICVKVRLIKVWSAKTHRSLSEGIFGNEIVRDSPVEETHVHWTSCCPMFVKPLKHLAKYLVDDGFEAANLRC